MAAVRHHALKPGDHRDLAAFYRRDQRVGVDRRDAGAGVRLDRPDRQLPAEPAARGEARGLERQREQPGGDLFARGDDDVIFRSVVGRIGFAAELDEAVGFPGHRGHDDGDLMPRRHLSRDECRDGPDTLGSGHRRPAEFSSRSAPWLRLVPPSATPIAALRAC